jgi:predicted O-linked N-acetylglucosamine transferase (SPINDLY family)
LHTERLVRFAPTAWAYQPPHDAPGVSPLACAGGGPVTFGCFGSPTKFTDPLFAAWARLLREVVDARLVLKGRDFDETPVRDHLFARMRAQGIPLEHVDLLPRAVDTKSHLTLYGRVDVVLDTFPYNGTTTTCEALWMGRPVVSILGNRHAARVGASLLTAIGHPEWIAKDVDDYVRVAAELANNRAQLASASSSLREAMQHSPLLDHASQAKRFADAIRTCWRERVGNAVNATCAA